MKCWRLKSITKWNLNGHTYQRTDIGYFDNLWIALCVANTYVKELKCECSLTYKDWR